MQRSSVVLPQPDGPTMVTISRSPTIEVDAAEHFERAVALGEAADANARRRAGGCSGRAAGSCNASRAHASARLQGAIRRSTHFSAAVSVMPRNISRITGTNVLSVSKMWA